MLYLVSTPIGNLADITLRALETLKAADLILCEDTRTSQVLLKRYSIHTPLKSYHKFNEKQLEGEVLSLLKKDKKIALISDAGTPGISDPGGALVKLCQEKNVPVTVIPGPSAPIAALTLSGMEMDRFQFVGFLPKKEGERTKLLLEALHYPGVTIAFESPNRIHKTLSEIASLNPDQEVAIARELTKIYEELVRGRVKDLVEHPIRGEVVLLIWGYAEWDYTLTPEEHVRLLQEKFSLSKQEAIKLAATLRGVSKREIYF
ncbi:MAG: Ribosomal RNA small subunit methyltransferase I [Chlamydiae bacterium]|nr:Ribosomal RNA small subunit methyltransferase I [Chlamydiota bacterium]